MPKTRTTTETIYKFAELSDEAKEKAREWYRSGALDYEWWDSVYEDANTIAGLLGLDLDVKGRNPCIWFSGFSSQGDGACFEGWYSYSKGSVKDIKSHAPQDTELHRIATGLATEQRRAFYGVTASIGHRGRYHHEQSMDIDVACSNKNPFDSDTVEELLRDFACWMYRQLENEHDYLLSDEIVDESIEANEYEFDEYGNRG